MSARHRQREGRERGQERSVRIEEEPRGEAHGIAHDAARIVAGHDHSVVMRLDEFAGRRDEGAIAIDS